jgi:hypothetical protein
MDLAPLIADLRRDLEAAAAPGGAEVTRAAELLGGSLESSARLCLLDALTQAADEVSTKLRSASVELRLRGREADFVVSEADQAHGPDVPAPPAPPAPPPAPGDVTGDVTRITLRLPEGLKDAVERASANEGISVNAWLVRAVAAAVHGGPPGPSAPPGRGMPRRITGYGRA